MDFKIEDIDSPHKRVKHLMQYRVLSDYEQTLLKALMAQTGPVTAFALVAWHLDQDATPEDAIAGIGVVESLLRDGYLCMTGEYVTVDGEQRSVLTMRMGEMSPIYQVILKILYESPKPLWPSQVDIKLPDREGFYALLKEANMHRVWDSVSPAYSLGIQLSNLKSLGYVCKSSGYCLNSTQRMALKHRFPAWDRKPEVPQGDVNPVALVTSQSVRAGRVVEID
jgi:hypothetical protein